MTSKLCSLSAFGRVDKKRKFSTYYHTHKATVQRENSNEYEISLCSGLLCGKKEEKKMCKIYLFINIISPIFHSFPGLISSIHRNQLPLRPSPAPTHFSIVLVLDINSIMDTCVHEFLSAPHSGFRGDASRPSKEMGG
jgi:hypothetical protein